MARTPLETVLFWFSVASFRIKKTDAATGPFHHAIRISSRLNRRASSRESASSGISIHGWSFGSYSGVFGSSGMVDPFFLIFSLSGIPSCERIPDIGVNIKGNKIAFWFKVCIVDSVSRSVLPFTHLTQRSSDSKKSLSRIWRTVLVE